VTKNGHGGAREGAGRKPGRKNRPKLQLEVVTESHGEKLTPRQRQALLRRQVALMRADSMSDDAIAAVIAIPVDQLRAVFGRELAHGREIIRSEVLARLDQQSESGNVSAGKALLAAADGEPTTAHGEHAPDSVAARALRIIDGGKT
jgi:hypothetical protein